MPLLLSTVQMIIFTTEVILSKDYLFVNIIYLLIETLEGSTFTEGPIVVVMLTDFM